METAIEGLGFEMFFKPLARGLAAGCVHRATRRYTLHGCNA